MCVNTKSILLLILTVSNYYGWVGYEVASASAFEWNAYCTV